VDVHIRLLWLPQAQFAGYLIAEQESRRDNQRLRILCEPADFKTGPAAAVFDGDSHFAVASPAHVLESEWPSQLVWLLTIQQESPLVYPVRQDSGITGPHDLAGRKVAVWPGNEDLELQWMLKRAGVDPSAVVRLPVEDTVGAFLSGDADCAQMTCYHELHLLEAELGNQDTVRLLRASDQDAGLVKDGLIARRDFVESNEALVQTFVNAVLAGWTRAFTNAEATLDACLAARPDMSRASHARQLEGIRALSLCNATLSQGLGYPDRRHVENAIAAARAVGLPHSVVTADEITAPHFWQAAPVASRPRTF